MGEFCRTMPGYSLSDFDFALPPDLIAQHPAAERSGSRLLDASGREPVDRIFRELPGLLAPGDLLVFNDTRVVKARLFGEKPTGGKAELLIERVLQGREVVAHMKVSKKPLAGTALRMAGGFTATLIGRWPDAFGPLFRFTLDGDPQELMALHGHVPLPSYIQRDQRGGQAQLPARHACEGDALARDSDARDNDSTHLEAQDERRYQTVFAKNPGAVAAPTAALHFDEALLAALDARGVRRAAVTLHVGAGTFQPVKSENLGEHRMHSEWYDVPPATQAALAETRERGGRVIAAGTTTVRTLESWARSGDATGDTAIFITPGFEFKVVDRLITNFHLPKSTLLMLVSAFTGYERIRELYAHAIDERYRFFSYGDAMLLDRQPAGKAID